MPKILAKVWQSWVKTQRGSGTSIKTATAHSRGTFKAAKAFFKGLAHVQMLPKGERAQRLRQAYIDTTGKQLFSYLSDV